MDFDKSIFPPPSTGTKHLFLLCTTAFPSFSTLFFFQSCRQCQTPALSPLNNRQFVRFPQKYLYFPQLFMDCTQKNTHYHHFPLHFSLYFFKIRNPMKFHSFYFFVFYFSIKIAIFSTLKKFLSIKISLKYFLSTCIFPFFIIK